MLWGKELFSESDRVEWVCGVVSGGFGGRGRVSQVGVEKAIGDSQTGSLWKICSEGTVLQGQEVVLKRAPRVTPAFVQGHQWGDYLGNLCKLHLGVCTLRCPQFLLWLG